MFTDLLYLCLISFLLFPCTSVRENIRARVSVFLKPHWTVLSIFVLRNSLLGPKLCLYKTKLWEYYNTHIVWQQYLNVFFKVSAYVTRMLSYVWFSSQRYYFYLCQLINLFLNDTDMKLFISLWFFMGDEVFSVAVLMCLRPEVITVLN